MKNKNGAYIGNDNENQDSYMKELYDQDLKRVINGERAIFFGHLNDSGMENSHPELLLFPALSSAFGIVESFDSIKRGDYVQAVLDTALGFLPESFKKTSKSMIKHMVDKVVDSDLFNKFILGEKKHGVSLVNKLMRNSEWNNFLESINGNNYYRFQKKYINPLRYGDDEKIFVSHTTPWDEFIPKESEGSAYNVLFEFPHKVFGDRKPSNSKGVLSKEGDLVQNGEYHLLYGDKSSGEIAPVRVISDENAEVLGMSPFIYGRTSRPKNKLGYYDNNPYYENVHQGNQTVVKGSEIKDAILNSNHSKYVKTDDGVVKVINVGSYADGGIVDENKNKDWLINWLENRKDKIGDNATIGADVSDRDKREIADAWFNVFKDRISNLKSYTYNENNKPEDQALIDDIIRASGVDNIDSLKNKLDSLGVKGMYMNGSNSIFYPSEPSHGVAVHEMSHALHDYTDKDSGKSILKDAVGSYMDENEYLLDNVKPSTYYESTNEIYSRLNEFRKNNNLSPDKEFSDDEIKEMRSNPNIKDSGLFERYNDGFIKHLLNNVAYNNSASNDDVMIAEDGGNVISKQRKAYDYFTNKRGMSKIQALAVLGNLMAESGLIDDIYGDNNTSYGIQQWHNERKDALFRHAKKKGHKEPTFEDQIEFLADEYEGKTGYSNFLYKRKGEDGPGYYNYSLQDFQDADSLRDAVVAWNQGAGRPHKSVIRNDDRYNEALNVAKNIGVEVDVSAPSLYGQMGYKGSASPIPDNTVIEDGIIEDETVNESVTSSVENPEDEAMGKWVDTYGKDIIAQLMSMNGKEVSQSPEETGFDYKQYVKDEEEDKRKAIIQAVLPNIQLKIKGVTEVGK